MTSPVEFQRHFGIVFTKTAIGKIKKKFQVSQNYACLLNVEHF